MLSFPAFCFSCSFGVVGLALSADSGFDWDTDDDDDYESPFANDSDERHEDDDTSSPSASTDDEFDWGTDELSNDDESTSAAGDESVSGSSADNPESFSEGDESALLTMRDARTLCDEAMDLLHAGETTQAFDRLGAHWAFSQDEMTELQREVERTRAVVADRYGDALDYRLVREDTTADVLARFVYLERFERHGLRWRFTFYEGANGWSLNDVFFDDEIEALLE